VAGVAARGPSHFFVVVGVTARGTPARQNEIENEEGEREREREKERERKQKQINFSKNVHALLDELLQWMF
jgi:hypothetical protein